jgi:hypothetical protein
MKPTRIHRIAGKVNRSNQLRHGHDQVRQGRREQRADRDFHRMASAAFFPGDRQAFMVMVRMPSGTAPQTAAQPSLWLNKMIAAINTTKVTTESRQHLQFQCSR